MQTMVFSTARCCASVERTNYTGTELRIAACSCHWGRQMWAVGWDAVRSSIYRYFLTMGSLNWTVVQSAYRVINLGTTSIRWPRWAGLVRWISPNGQGGFA